MSDIEAVVDDWLSRTVEGVDGYTRRFAAHLVAALSRCDTCEGRGETYAQMPMADGAIRVMVGHDPRPCSNPTCVGGKDVAKWLAVIGVGEVEVWSDEQLDDEDCFVRGRYLVAHVSGGSNE